MSSSKAIQAIPAVKMFTDSGEQVSDPAASGLRGAYDLVSSHAAARFLRRNG